MRSILIILGVLIASLQICNTQVIQKPTCSANGEYCQNHWECCSNSCYSYLYKCVKSGQQGQLGFASAPVAGPTIAERQGIDVPPPPGVNVNKPTITIEELINSLFAPTPQPPQFDIYQYLLSSRLGEENSDTSSTGSTSGTQGSTTTKECKAIGQKCYRDSECCTKRCHGFLHQCVT